MSVIFGTCLFDDVLVDKTALSRLAKPTQRYGPDGTFVSADREIGMGFQAFHTHERSKFEGQPASDHVGNMIVLDGRIDNHEDIAVREGLPPGSLSDSDLILRLFLRHGEDCFARLVGDWALALWSGRTHTLYLARDHAGSRALYYQKDRHGITWSTYLETFLLEAGAIELDRECLGRYLALQDLGGLTPYKGIISVPPAHFVSIDKTRMVVRSHWHWIADTTIRYQSDEEYEENFLHLFSQAVARRIGRGAPIVAELSGGMDSSSIVCMADKNAGDHAHSLQKVGTISYFDDSEPDWNERPYFTAVEVQRQSIGVHLDCSCQHHSYRPLPISNRVYPYLDGDAASLERSDQFERSVEQFHYRVILSGVGGDELLGGVPTPLPELSNHLIGGHLFTLLRRTGDWCLSGRQPVWDLLHATVAFTTSLYWATAPDPKALPAWLSAEVRASCRLSRRPIEARPRLLTALPSAVANGRAWWSIIDSLPHLTPTPVGCYEYRYPYLDRDLVSFLHRIPREQLVQPGRRRKLMRNALRNMVPTLVLERKRKAYVSRAPLANLRAGREDVEHLFNASLCAQLGLIDELLFRSAFRTGINGEIKWISYISRAINLELWLRNRASHGATLSAAKSSTTIATTLPPT